MTYSPLAGTYISKSVLFRKRIISTPNIGNWNILETEDFSLQYVSPSQQTLKQNELGTRKKASMEASELRGIQSL